MINDAARTSALERLERVRYGTCALHCALDALWDELPQPRIPRQLVVRGFANIVRQHVVSQWILVQRELDVSAAALVRPTYEALLRVIWTMCGADDQWIDGFLRPNENATNSDAETRKGPDVVAMLATIAETGVRVHFKWATLV